LDLELTVQVATYRLTRLERSFALSEEIAGDYNYDGTLDHSDIEFLKYIIHTAQVGGFYDVDGDGEMTPNDATAWMTDIYGTLPGDANLDLSVVSRCTDKTKHGARPNISAKRTPLRSVSPLSGYLAKGHPFPRARTTHPNGLSQTSATEFNHRWQRDHRSEA